MKRRPSANRKSVSTGLCPFFFPLLLPFPPPSTHRAHCQCLTWARRARVHLGRIHLQWWCIALLRSFIYCGWPLLNLLLVSEHDKRISSTALHSSCIAQTAQIPHRPCRRETTKPAERSHRCSQKAEVVLNDVRRRRNLRVVFPPKAFYKGMFCKSVCHVKGFNECQGRCTRQKKKQRTQICTYLMFLNNSRFKSQADVSTFF